MPKIDIDAVPARKGVGYPPPFDAPCADRVRRRLGDAGGLTDFGVNLCSPTCVAARMQFFPDSTVRLSDPRKTSRGFLFTRAVITYTLNGSKREFTAYPES